MCYCLVLLCLLDKWLLLILVNKIILGYNLFNLFNKFIKMFFYVFYCNKYFVGVFFYEFVCIVVVNFLGLELEQRLVRDSEQFCRFVVFNYFSKESLNVVYVLFVSLGIRNLFNFFLFFKQNLEVSIVIIETLQNIILQSFGYLNCFRNFIEDLRVVFYKYVVKKLLMCRIKCFIF